MTLVDLHVDMGRVADALEKIVFLLEKLVFPPAPREVPAYQATLDDLHIVTPEDHERNAQEQMAFAERYRVVPGSEAMAQALADWEDEQRSIHGEAWQAPEDWRTIFAAAGRGEKVGGTVRQPLEPAAPADQRRRAETSETSAG